MKLIDKSALVAEIEKQKQLIFPKNTGEMKVADVPKPLEQGWLNALSWMKKTIDTLEVKEVDLDAELEHYKTDQNIKYEEDINMFEFAKHFFELGLSVNSKAQKGEEYDRQSTEN